jgi:N-acetylmuramoyl-L-alanine amidase
MVILTSEFHPDSCLVAEVRSSPNFGERRSGAKIDMVLLHYTGMVEADAAVRHLCTRGTDVSAHYVVLENGHIIQCVPERMRAWHAGQSTWSDEADINSCSIGIEIVNPGHDHGYPDFPRRQIAAVTALCRGILTRHHIPTDRVLAHSDVAPARKRDPGEKFPWRILHRSGIGMWVRPAPIVPGPIFVLGDRDNSVDEAQVLLAKFGYGIARSGYLDGATRDAVAAFQRHFRPAKVDGVLDVSTLETLRSVTEAQERVRAEDIAQQKLVYSRVAS